MNRLPLAKARHPDDDERHVAWRDADGRWVADADGKDSVVLRAAQAAHQQRKQQQQQGGARASGGSSAPAAAGSSEPMNELPPQSSIERS